MPPRKSLVTGACFSLMVTGAAILSQPAHADLYASGGNSILYQVDPSSGNAAGIGFTGVPPLGSPPNVVPLFGMAFSASGTLFAIPEAGGLTTDQLWTVNTTPTAVAPPVGLLNVATVIGSLGLGSSTAQATGLAFSPGGTLYTTYTPVGAASGELLTVNPSTGATTPVGSLGVPQGQLAFAPNGDLFLAYTPPVFGSPPLEPSYLAEVNSVTGAATLLGSIGFDDVFGLAFVGNTLVGAASVTGGDDSQFIDINTTTGAGTFVADLNNLATSSNDVPIDSLAESPVPEPSTFPLLLSGLGLVGLMALRRAHQRHGAAN